jgi:hypothetical protein
LFRRGINALNNIGVSARNPKFSPSNELLMLLLSGRGGSDPELPTGWKAGGLNPFVFDIGVDADTAHSGR